MTATPLPESAPTIPSLPRNLYLGAKDHPHWSETIVSRDLGAVEVTHRRQQLAAIHDSLHQLRAAATAIGNLDRNGLTLAAADNIELSLEHTASVIATLVTEMRAAAARYTKAELLAATPPPADVDEEEAPAPGTKRGGGKINAIQGIVYTHGPGGVPLSGGGILPPAPSPAEMARIVEARQRASDHVASVLRYSSRSIG